MSPQHQALVPIRPASHSANVLEYSDGRLLVTYFCGTSEGSEDQITVGHWYDATAQTWSEAVILLRAFAFDSDRWVSEQVAAIENDRGETIIYAWASPFSSFTGIDWSGSRGAWHRDIAASKLFRFRWDDTQVSEPECLHGQPGMEERGLYFQGRPLQRDPGKGPAGGWIIPYGKWLGHEDTCARFLMVEADGVTCAATGQDLYQFPGCAEPALARISNDHWLCYMRYFKRGEGFIWRSESTDGGHTFTEPILTNLRNPHSAVDIFYDPGEELLLCAYNDSHSLRTPLTLAASRDLGRTFCGQDIETSTGRFSYPKIYRTRDGQCHLFYSHNRDHIEHVRFDTDWLLSGRRIVGLK